LKRSPIGEIMSRVEQKYHQLRKQLEADIRFTHERRPDHEEPWPKKKFYAPAILISSISTIIASSH